MLLVGNYLAGQLIWPASNVLDDRTRIIIQEINLLKGLEEQGLNFYLKIKYEGTFIRNKILLSLTLFKINPSSIFFTKIGIKPRNSIKIKLNSRISLERKLLAEPLKSFSNTFPSRFSQYIFI